MWKTGKLQQSRTIVPATTTPFHRHAFSVSCLCSPPTRSLVFSVTVRSTDRSLSSSSHHHNDCFSQDFIQGVMVQAFRITPKEVRAALNAASDVSKQKTAIKAALIGVQPALIAIWLPVGRVSLRVTVPQAALFFKSCCFAHVLHCDSNFFHFFCV